jgi:hypothetical protein
MEFTNSEFALTGQGQLAYVTVGGLNQVQIF